MNHNEYEEIEGQGALFPEDQLYELDNQVEVGGSSPYKSPSPSSHDADLELVPASPGEQMELPLGIPTEEEAHEMWIKLKDEKDSLYDIANRVYDQKRLTYKKQDKEVIISGLMYEGMLALKQWKRDRGRSLVSFVWDRMKRRLQRIIATLLTDDIRCAANSNQMQKFWSIRAYFEEETNNFGEHYAEAEAMWIESGEDPDLFAWLAQDLIHPDQMRNEDSQHGDVIEDGWSSISGDFRPIVEQQHVPGSLSLMHDDEIWDYLFHEETLPLWTQGLDADDFRVLDQRRADPEASARQIGRILGHDKNWVIRRDDKIKRALKGFITITEEVSNEA